MSNSYIAFDLGAESGRAILGQLENGRLTLAEKHRFQNIQVRSMGHIRWNTWAQFAQIKEGLRKSCRGLSRLPASMAVDTWGVDFGLLNHDGELLSLPYAYRDSLTEGAMPRFFREVPASDLFAVTGIQFMRFNTIFQLHALKRAGSEVLACADQLLFTPDLFAYLLSGKKVSEYSIASTSSMLDARTRQWATGLLEEVGLPTHVLGQIVSSGTVLGPLLKDVAAETETGAIPVVATAGHDTASAVASVPAVGTKWCYISSGTWSLMGVELLEPIISAKTLKYNYTNEGGAANRIRLLRNIMGLWLLQECRRDWARLGQEYDYSTLVDLASKAEPFAALLNPDHPPFLAPDNMLEKMSAFLASTGQAMPHTVGGVARMCLESLALTYALTLEGLEDICGHTIEAIHIVGGGSQNHLLNQMTADLCQRPVLAGPIEATAIGNVLVQAMALGHVSGLEEIREIVRNSFEPRRFDPRPDPAGRDALGRFRELLRKR